MKKYVSVGCEFNPEFNLKINQSNWPNDAFWGSPVDAHFSEQDWFERVEERKITHKPIVWSLSEGSKVFEVDEHTIDCLPTVTRDGKKFFDYTELASEYDAIELVWSDRAADGLPGTVGGIVGTVYQDWPIFEVILILNPDKIVFENDI